MNDTEESLLLRGWLVSFVGDSSLTYLEK